MGHALRVEEKGQTSLEFRGFSFVTSFLNIHWNARWMSLSPDLG